MSGIKTLIQELQLIEQRAQALERCHAAALRLVENALTTGVWDGAALQKLLSDPQAHQLKPAPDVCLRAGAGLQQMLHQAPEQRGKVRPAGASVAAAATYDGATAALPAPTLIKLLVDEEILYLAVDDGVVYRRATGNTALPVGQLTATMLSPSETVVDSKLRLLPTLTVDQKVYQLPPQAVTEMKDRTGYFVATEGAGVPETLYEPVLSSCRDVLARIGTVASDGRFELT